MNKLLKTVYNDPKNPGSYGGIRRLWQAVKNRGYTYNDVKGWLDTQDTYTLHKPVRKKFVRQRVLVAGIDAQWQADLVDMPQFVKQNDGVRYLLTVIDVFSKYAWVVLLRSKHGPVVRDALAAIFAEGRVPKKLQTDDGVEFFNQWVKALLTDHNVHLFSSRNNETKASVVERFNRTLKTDMWRYFTGNNTYRYIDIVQDLVYSYNNRILSSIKMIPSKVTVADTEKVRTNLYGKKLRTKEKALSVGDTVLISKPKRLFEKGYLPNWTYEQFTIAERLKTRPIRYRLKDYNDDVIDGTFYGAELQKTTKREAYRIEKIIRRRGKKVLVKWMGYPDSFNQWIDNDAIGRL